MGTAGARSLDTSRDAVLAAARGRHGAAILAHAAAGRVVAGWTLDPAPVEPAAHVERTHERGRRHLQRLLEPPAGVEVRSPMTGQLFDRLTQPADPARRKPIDYTAVESYTYTPRKPLRRVHDHALDHLNQIEQWMRWRRDGVVPTPTDGWAPSTVTLPEDRLPLTATDLDAWLWRVDQAVRLLADRAARLSRDELDWEPPDGGWTLRRVLHHVARSEILYASAFAEALPEDPVARYVEADARLGPRLDAARARADDPAVVFPDPYGTFRTPAEVVAEVLALERELLSRAA
ncbi:MAG TPA: DinB family protein [Methylomirabilota bacterium]|nr:DinB family protein [Methylomirabilota bacterium]